MASPTLQGAPKDGSGEAVMACDMPEPCKFPSLDIWQKKFLWLHREVDLALHPVLQVLGSFHMKRKTALKKWSDKERWSLIRGSTALLIKATLQMTTPLTDGSSQRRLNRKGEGKFFLNTPKYSRTPGDDYLDQGTPFQNLSLHISTPLSRPPFQNLFLLISI